MNNFNTQLVSDCILEVFGFEPSFIGLNHMSNMYVFRLCYQCGMAEHEWEFFGNKIYTYQEVIEVLTRPHTVIEKL